MRLAVWRCFPGGLRSVLQDPVDDAGVGLLRSLSKGWDAGAGSHGLCDPLGDTECRIRETADYIEDAQRLVGGRRGPLRKLATPHTQNQRQLGWEEGH